VDLCQAYYEGAVAFVTSSLKVDFPRQGHKSPLALLAHGGVVTKNLELRQKDADLRTAVGDRLALARTSMGLRQNQWVEKYQQFLTKQKLSGYETGTRFPSLLFLIVLCEDYGFSMDYFLRGTMHGVSTERATGLETAKAALTLNFDALLDPDCPSVVSDRGAFLLHGAALSGADLSASDEIAALADPLRSDD